MSGRVLSSLAWMLAIPAGFAVKDSITLTEASGVQLLFEYH